LRQLRANAIESCFDAGLFRRDDFESTLNGNVWGLDLNN
jgi:hypothetical protein